VVQVEGWSDHQQVVVLSVVALSPPVPVEVDQCLSCFDGPGREEHQGQRSLFLVSCSVG